MTSKWLCGFFVTSPCQLALSWYSHLYNNYDNFKYN